jgi:hypothetical protein
VRPLPAGEALEGACHHILGEPATLIGHVQTEQLATSVGGQRDRATAVLQRIGDEVIQRLCCAVGIGKQPAASRHVANHDLSPSCTGGGAGARRGRFE